MPWALLIGRHRILYGAWDRNQQSASKFALLDHNAVTETAGTAGAVTVVNDVLFVCVYRLQKIHS